LDRSHAGVVYRSIDGKQVFRALRDRFILSRLAPYGTWQDLKTEAERLWEIYKMAIPVARIGRVAVRYINRIDFHQSTVEFKDFLNTYPEITASVPDNVTNFFMRIEIPQPDIESFVVLVESALPPCEEGKASMIVDIDAYKIQDPPSSIENPWIALELLRDRKNQYFEALITDRTRKLFGERNEC